MLKDMFIAAITSRETTEKITACFRNGREITFTSRMLNTLKTDPAVAYVYDTETGEIIFENE